MDTQNGAARSLPWKWISGRWLGERYHGGEQVGEWRVLMGFSRLSPCYFAKMGEMEIVRLRAGKREKVDPKWLNGGTLT